MHYNNKQYYHQTYRTYIFKKNQEYLMLKLQNGIIKLT